MAIAGAAVAMVHDGMTVALEVNGWNSIVVSGGSFSSMLGQVSLATFAGCDEVDELTTDTGADQATLEALADAGLRTQLVDPQPSRRSAEGTAS